MSLPRATPLRKGILKGTIYTFDKVGDALPEHSHSAHNSHITIIQLGRIMARGSGWEMVLDPAVEGARMVAFKPGQVHSLIALESGSIAINIVYGSGLDISDSDLI